MIRRVNNFNYLLAGQTSAPVKNAEKDLFLAFYRIGWLRITPPRNSILFGFAHRSVPQLALKNAIEKTKTDNKNVSNGDRLPSFVRYNLSDDERDQAKNAAETLQDVGEIISQLVDEGYKFSASHDNYGGGTQVFITPQRPDSANAGWTLSARAPSLVLAVGVLAWKHFTLFGRDWPKESEPRPPRNSIG